MTLTVGVPGEVKNSEHRVAITPDGVRELSEHGVDVLVEQGAGAVVGDRRRRVPGGRGEDRPHRRGRVGGRARLQGEGAAARGARASCGTTSCSSPTSTSPPTPPWPTRCSPPAPTGVAYETVQLENGELPLLAPMSEVAGRMATQIGAHYLERENGGRGVLLGGAPGRAARAGWS